jgi:hypothetical protein
MQIYLAPLMDKKMHPAFNESRVLSYSGASGNPDYVLGALSLSLLNCIPNEEEYRDES